MDLRKLPAPELLRCCLQGDQACWLEFVRRYQPLMAAVIVKTIRRWKYSSPAPALVDDLLQETYLKLFSNNFRALREFDFRHEAALFGFLKVVTSNVVHDYLRKIRPTDESDTEPEAWEPVPSAAAYPRSGVTSEDPHRNILIGEIRQCLETYAAEPTFTRDCAIFFLYYQQGFTAQAISELPGIGLTVKGVESTLLRLIRLIREKMNTRRKRPKGSAGSGS